ncbi:uncharacterized protein JCM10292_001574 [Rhodotorula paludigena]|uniref:uncharacterized protein n=1 Tax=Rhodotorula paludigena TaxID=86838 RepID=UPI003170B907
MPSTSSWNENLPLKIVNILTFVFLFGSNTYGSLTPYGTGRDTYFTPEAWVFYTWTIIDVLLLGYVIYQFFDGSHEVVHGVGWRFPLVGILNAIFVHVFVTRHYIVAFIFAILVASTVSTIYYSLSAHLHAKSAGDALFVHLPFSLWHAWSIVTVFISGFALFTHSHKNHPSVISIVLVVAAEAFLTLTAVGYALRSREGDAAGAAVLFATLVGIFQHQHNDVIRYCALAGAIVSGVAIAKSLYFTFVARDRGVSLGSDDERRPLVA